MRSVKQRCIYCLSSIFTFDEFDVLTVNDDTELFKGKSPIGDSLDLVEYVMALEDEFKIQIPDKVAEELNTIGDATDYITKRIAS